MGITLVNYITSFIVFITATFIFLKNKTSVNSGLIALFCLTAALLGLFMGLAFDLGNAGLFDLSKLFTILTAASLYALYLTMFRISLTFPYEKKMPAVAVILTVLWIITVCIFLFTDLYLIGIELKNNIYFRIEGSLYKFFTVLGMLVMISAMIILLIRRKKFDNPIHKLQTVVIIIGLIVSMAIGVFASVIIPSMFGIFNLYPLSSIMGVVIAGSLFYAIITYRMFDITTAIHKTVIFLLFSSIIGVLAGLSFATLNYLIGSKYLYITTALFSVLFVLLILLRGKIQKHLIRLFKRKTEYLEDLEIALDNIDYSTGSDKVIESLIEILAENIGTTHLTIICENTIGDLEILYSETGIEKTSLEKDDDFMKFLINTNQRVILKSEVFSNPVFSAYKTELLDIFLQFSAEALVICVEGTQVIGVIALGEKESMKPYDTYDFDALDKILPKLFVVMYFLRNIERQAVAITVDKEIKFSQQIISSLLRNIDAIESPKMDFQFLSKFTSGLGGDFVDVIKIGKSKYLIVVGDIAGKGINASMSMIILKSVIRTFLKETSDFKTLINKVNRFVKQHLPRGTFFAGLFMIYDESAGTVFYINCGIPIIYLYSSDYNSVIEIQGEGKVLGFVMDISKFIKVRKISLTPDDVMLIVTDGILDSQSLKGEAFGKTRLSSHLSENHLQPSKFIIDNLFEKFLNFVSGSLKDDITIVALKYNNSVKGGTDG
jgi:serine phosphatase RsbU (regulator of sigma subunit)